MDTPSQRKNISGIGIVFTIAVSAGFVWAAIQWLNRDVSPTQFTAAEMRSNELKAFSNLQLISQAQKKYKETDWDGDGKKIYAMYFVHLWRSVNAAGEPIRVELIPKRLGFAMDAARAIDGYYFVDLHDRISHQAGGLIPMNYEKEWAVLGVPVSHGQTGTLNFLADSFGNIYINPAKYLTPQYPEDISSSGWKKIETIQQLTGLQRNIYGKIFAR